MGQQLKPVRPQAGKPKGKTLGILTSGGDCAGLNATIRAVAFRAIQTYGWRVLGIRDGTLGLMRRPVDFQELTVKAFAGTLLREGGTLLGSTNRGEPFAYPMPDGSIKDRSEEIIEGYREIGLDALIVIGGDGSLAIARRLAQQGNMNLIGIPKTIDNDVAFTENAIGFSTAVGVATDALDRLQPTAASHSRVMILEVMGRDAGHIALNAGIAGGANVVLIPEIPYKLENVAAHLDYIAERTGRNFALVVVAEGLKTQEGETMGSYREGSGFRLGGIGHYVAEQLTRLTSAEIRVTVLGHVQRGGSPSAQDRMLASAFGVHAVDLAVAGKFDRMVAWSNRACIDVALSDVVDVCHAVDPDGAVVRTARGLGISFGDLDPASRVNGAKEQV